MEWISGIGFNLNKLGAILLLVLLGEANLCHSFAEGKVDKLFLLRITKVSSDFVVGEDSEKIQTILGIAKGRTLDIARMNAGIHTLVAQQKVQALFVELEDHVGGLHVHIRGVRFRSIRNMSFSRIDPDILEDVRSKWQRDEGRKLDIRSLSNLKERLLSAYELKGYYRASVSIVINEVPGTKEADIQVWVEARDPSTISEVKIIGVPPEEQTRIRQVIDLKKGGPYTRALLDGAVDAINSYLRVSQYLTSRVEDTSLRFEGDKSTVEVRLFIRLGEKFQVEFSGNKVFDDVELREFMTSEILSQVDASQLLSKMIETKYRSIGYHFCKVKGILLNKDSEKMTVLRFDIVEGDKVIVDKVIFRGAEAMEGINLQGIFFDAAPGVLRRKLYWEEGIREANEGLRMKVNSLGYLTMTLTGPRAYFSDDRRGVQLIYEVEPGVQTRFGNVVVSGNRHLTREEITEVISFKSGEPFNRESVTLMRRAVIERYRESGWVEAKFEDRHLDGVVLSKDRRLASVEININEGPRYYVGRVSVDGNRKTQDRVILREVKVKEGDVYNPELIRRSEDDIALIGLFSRVEIVSTADPTRKDRKDLKIIVNEAAPGLGEFGVGGVYEEPRFRLRTFGGIGYRNLIGLNHTGSARGEVGIPLASEGVKFIEYSTVLGYRVPYPFEVPLTFTAQTTLDNFEIVTSPLKVKTRAQIEGRIEKKLWPVITGLYRLYRLERSTIETFDDERTSEDESAIDRDVIGSTGPGLVIDLRDDAFNPLKGSYHLLDLELAHPALLSNREIAFVMASSRNSFYFPLFSPFSFALYAGFGYAESIFSDQNLPASRITRDLALGGRGSVRGYTVGRFYPGKSTVLGKPDTPVQKAAFYNFRIELTGALISDFSGAIFFDTGQLYPDWRPDTRNDGVGLGMRYRTPVGPIVVDLAQALGENREEIKFYFTVGTF